MRMRMIVIMIMIIMSDNDNDVYSCPEVRLKSMVCLKYL